MPRAVILAGGKGTRLQPFSVTFPKPLVPLGDMPILEILLRRLVKNGVTDVTLTLGHLAALIQAYVDQRLRSELPDLRIQSVVEDHTTGTAGSLALVPGLDSTFLAMNGDLLTNLDLRTLVEHHRASGAQLTIASHTRQMTTDLGVLQFNERGELVDYLEKPTHEYQASMGIYVYEPSVLELIPRGQRFDFPDLVLSMLERGLPISVHRFEGLWLDIGRPDDYAAAQDLFTKSPDAFL